MREEQEQYSTPWGKVVIVLTILGAIASIATCATGILPVPSCSPRLGSTTVDDSLTPSPTSTPVAFPLSTPNSRASLESMLEAATMATDYDLQGQALRVVAEHAVRMSDYEMAIKAGEETSRYAIRSETLAFVALCAARKGNFEDAVKAVESIPTYRVKSETALEIVKIQSVLEASRPSLHLAKAGPTVAPEGCP